MTPMADQNTCKRYHVRSASYGSPHCHCDAVIVKELVAEEVRRVT
jgi:hypothetical protein